MALARALAPGPQLLLLDEPLSAVDGPARRALLDTLTGLVAALPLPVLYVTHATEEAARIGERRLLYTPRPAAAPDGAGLERVVEVHAPA